MFFILKIESLKDPKEYLISADNVFVRLHVLFRAGFLLFTGLCRSKQHLKNWLQTEIGMFSHRDDGIFGERARFN